MQRPSSFFLEVSIDIRYASHSKTCDHRGLQTIMYNIYVRAKLIVKTKTF